MFDLGMQELIVIFVVALIVFGPKKLPELARTLGKGIHELKRAVSGVKEQLDEEVKDINEPLLDKKDFDILSEREGEKQEKTGSDQKNSQEDKGVNGSR